LHTFAAEPIGNQFKITINHSLINARKNFFGERAAGAWNSLSRDTVDFSSLGKFKNTLSLVDPKQFTEYQLSVFRCFVLLFFSCIKLII